MGQRSVIRAVDAAPQWLLPLSTIQNTRVADPVGLFAHDLVDEGGERHDPGGLLTPAERLGVVDVVGGEVGQRAAAAVFKVDPWRPACCSRQAWVATAQGLYSGFLVGADHILVTAEAATLPTALVQVQHAACFGFEIRVAGEVQHC